MPGLLVVPAAPDGERDRVADAWVRAGGRVSRLARFWEPPALDRSEVRLYGNDSFCLVLAEVLALDLVSPPDDLILELDESLLGREVAGVALGRAGSLRFPRFVKPLVPKQFPAIVHRDLHSLEAVTAGLDPSTLLIHSDPVRFTAEARAFVLGGEVAAEAVYEGDASLDGVAEVVAAVAERVRLPATLVVDLGRLEDRWVVVEFNATWGAGLNGCDPAAVVPCIAAATRSR